MGCSLGRGKRGTSCQSEGRTSSALSPMSLPEGDGRQEPDARLFLGRVSSKGLRVCYGAKWKKCNDGTSVSVWAWQRNRNKDFGKKERLFVSVCVCVEVDSLLSELDLSQQPD